MESVGGGVLYGGGRAELLPGANDKTANINTHTERERQKESCNSKSLQKRNEQRLMF